VDRSETKQVGPYAYSGSQWVSFDDVDTIRFKSKWALEMGLAGGMVWALDLDDFKNVCNCETHPLLKTINRVMRPRAIGVGDPSCPRLGGTGRNDGVDNGNIDSKFIFRLRRTHLIGDIAYYS
jgi:chitinase